MNGKHWTWWGWGRNKIAGKIDTKLVYKDNVIVGGFEFYLQCIISVLIIPVINLYFDVNIVSGEQEEI